MDMRAVTAFLLVAVLWTFSRQVQAFIVVAVAVPFLLLAWRRTETRRLALIGGAGIVVIGIWGTLSALQTSSVSPSGLAATNPSEVRFEGVRSSLPCRYRPRGNCPPFTAMDYLTGQH